MDADEAEKNAALPLRNSRHLVLWEVEGTPVSMAGYSGSTPNGIRVAPVYTPPENRGKGFAGACVAALSQKLLDDGRKFCFLYTDLANPTSNHIYQTIGYEPVADATVYSFSQE
jgi:predicted GNAT family acetyltransferase